MKLYLGADHRGFELKNSLAKWLRDLGHEVKDKGALSYEPTDDYPDFAFFVGEAVASDPSSLGVVICGSSIGVTVAANKVKGVRAASVCSLAEVKHGKARDGLNVLALAADRTSLEQAQELVLEFIRTQPSDQARFRRRTEKIKKYEDLHFKS